jgi:hypothetical protein
MDQVHFISGNGPLCGRADALWCTILREAVTCPRCLARLRAPGEGDAAPQAAASAASAPH